jgi:hypothetical protein
LYEYSATLAICKDYNSWAMFLKRHYPAHNWNESFFTARQRKMQKFVQRAAKKLLPKVGDIKSDDSPDFLGDLEENSHLDVYIPSLNLALEYHGEQANILGISYSNAIFFQHYKYTSIYGPPDLQMERDRLKREACERSGVTLIEVPYWWDMELSRY